MNASLKADLDRIMDCFTGADGGVSFLNLKTLLEDMSSQAGTGNENADTVCDLVTKFRNLIDVADRMVPEARGKDFEL